MRTWALWAVFSAMYPAVLCHGHPARLVRPAARHAVARASLGGTVRFVAGALRVTPRTIPAITCHLSRGLNDPVFVELVRRFENGCYDQVPAGQDVPLLRLGRWAFNRNGAYSPYQNVRDQVPYPAVLLLAGE